MHKRAIVHVIRNSVAVLIIVTNVCLTDWEHGTPPKITDHDFKNFFKFG